MFALLIGVVTAAVYSPLLSLTTIRIEGASRVKTADVNRALSGELGKPLALVNFAEVKRQLGAFALIRSYVTETVPPHTLIVRLSERSPIGVIATATGYSVVDPAGIVIQRVTDRPALTPIIDPGAGGLSGPGFAAAVDVLLALPADVLAKVDSISAQTKDTVSFSLLGSVQSVVWGGSEDSAIKARVLVALMKTQAPTTSVRFNVSAPSNPVVGPN